MALFNCPNCNSQISDKADACPNCGTKLEKKKKTKTIICKECKTEIQTKTKKCPNCGCPVTKNKKFVIILISILIVLAICGGVFGFLYLNDYLPFTTDNNSSTNSDVSSENTEIQLEDYELVAVKLIGEIKDRLKDPDSMKIHSMRVKQFFEGAKEYHYEIDYTATNGFGGATRETHYLQNGFSYSLNKFDFDTMIMALEKSHFKENSYVLDETLDVDKLLKYMETH